MTNIISKISSVLDFDQEVSTRIYLSFQREFEEDLEGTLEMLQSILDGTHDSILDAAPEMFVSKVDNQDIFGEEAGFNFQSALDEHIRQFQDRDDADVHPW